MSFHRDNTPKKMSNINKLLQNFLDNLPLPMKIETKQEILNLWNSKDIKKINESKTEKKARLDKVARYAAWLDSWTEYHVNSCYR